MNYHTAVEVAGGAAAAGHDGTGLRDWTGPGPGSQTAVPTRAAPSWSLDFPDVPELDPSNPDSHLHPCGCIVSAVALVGKDHRYHRF